jgi:hypothetical protein
MDTVGQGAMISRRTFAVVWAYWIRIWEGFLDRNNSYVAARCPERIALSDASLPLCAMTSLSSALQVPASPRPRQLRWIS